MAQAVNTVPAMSLIVQMANCAKYSLVQLRHFQGREISATPKEAEMLLRQADAMHKLADQWKELVSGSV